MQEQSPYTTIKPPKASPDHLLSSTLDSVNLPNIGARILAHSTGGAPWALRHSRFVSFFHSQHGEIFRGTVLLSNYSKVSDQMQKKFKGHIN